MARCTPTARTMTHADLCREWRATATPRASARDELVALGCAPRDVELLIGIGRVRLYRGDFYEPDPDGRACLITPVCVHTALDPESSAPEVFCRAGAIVDLVALSSRIGGRCAPALPSGSVALSRNT